MRSTRLFTVCLLAAALAGCATSPNAQAPAAPEHVAAIALLDQGKAKDAAARLETLAAAAPAAQRGNLQADAAFAWHDAGDDTRARALLAQLQPRRLSGESKLRHDLLVAELAIADGRAATALPSLTTPAAQIPESLRTRWLLARAQAQEAGGDAWSAAISRAQADATLQGKARDDNRRAIAKVLAGLDNAALAAHATALPEGDPLYAFAGRALLARGLPLPHPFARADQWNFSRRAPAQADGYRPPARLAVLLPLSGTLATAAAPVRDGLLAGYFAERRPKPELQFYDTAGTPAGALAAYRKAVAAGSDYVVGPLGRDEVDALFRQKDSPVPVLALNRGQTPPPPGDADFSLAPEDEGAAAAEFLLARGRKAVLVIGSADDTGRRAVAAFGERFRQRGGKVVASIDAGDTVSPLASPLQAAAQAGADAVFLAVRGAQAQGLMPQLALAGLGGATRVGTSQLAGGTGKPEQDVSLDGIAFPTERWSLHGLPGLPSPGSAVANDLPTTRGGAARLFAFGHDAWLISAYLPKLALDADGQVRGATGTLRLDGFGNIVRTPAWATYSGGQPVALPDGR